MCIVCFCNVFFSNLISKLFRKRKTSVHEDRSRHGKCIVLGDYQLSFMKETLLGEKKT